MGNMSTKGHKGHVYCYKYPKYKPCRIYKQISLDIITYCKHVQL